MKKDLLKPKNTDVLKDAIKNAIKKESIIDDAIESVIMSNSDKFINVVHDIAEAYKQAKQHNKLELMNKFTGELKMLYDLYSKSTNLKYDSYATNSLFKILEDTIPCKCPPPGVGFEAYKILVKPTIIRKLTEYASNNDDVPIYTDELCNIVALAKLYIPEEAQRSSSFSNKCRANVAIVQEIKAFMPDGKIMLIDSALSPVRRYCGDCITYKVDETVIVDYFDTNRWNECSSGIHFFLDEKRALQYANTICAGALFSTDSLVTMNKRLAEIGGKK